MPPAHRRGVSLVETLVALILVALGLLALAAGITQAARRSGAGQAHLRAAGALETAAARVTATLARGGCGAVLPSLGAPGVHVTAVVEPRAAHALVRLVAASALPGGRARRDTLALAVPC